MIRNRVKRRLRAIMSASLPTLPAGTAVVIRALPRAADVDFERLSADVTEALATAWRKAALA